MADISRAEVSRRGFLKGVGVTAATTVLNTAHAVAQDAREEYQRKATAGPEGTTS